MKRNQLTITVRVYDVDRKLSYVDMFSLALEKLSNEVYFPDIISIKPLYAVNSLLLMVTYYD